MNKTAIVFLLLVSCFAWWDFDWEYRKQVVIIGNATNSTIMFKLDTDTLVSNDKIQPDCDDLRIVLDDLIPASYFVEACNTTNTLVWFQTSSATSFYLYYGNPDASNSASSAAFEFLETFESESINSSGSNWVHQNGSWTVGTHAYSSSNLLGFQINETGYPGFAYANQQIQLTNYSVHGRLMDSYVTNNNPHPGMLITYQDDDNLDAVYFRSATNQVVWYKKRAGSVVTPTIASSTIDANEWYGLDVQVFENNADVYLDGSYIGNITSLDSPSYSGVFMAAVSSSDTGWWDNLGFYYAKNITSSLSGEIERPETGIEYIGTEAATMKTISMLYDAGWDAQRVYTRVRAGEETEKTGFLSNGSAVLSWATLTYNQSGYSINGSWRWLFADHLETRDGPLKARLIYTKTMGNHSFYHIVHIFKNYSVIKHSVIGYSESAGSTDYALQLDGSSVNFVWNGSINYGGANIKHNPTGETNVGDAVFCQAHWVVGDPPKIIWKYTGTAGRQDKTVFWENYGIPCDPFGKEIEILCGHELQNCTVESYRPLGLIAYYSGTPGPLGSFYTDNSNINCSLNGQTLGELFNTSIITNQSNIISCSSSSSQPINTMRLSIQYPYTATAFFGEKPGLIKAEFEGGIGGGAIEISGYGVPVFGNIVPFRQDSNLLSFDYDFPAGNNKLYIFKLSSQLDWHESIDVMDTIAVSLDEMEMPVLRFFSSQEFPVYSLPRTSSISSARTISYSNNTFAEIRVSIWKVA
ncbi:MAG: DUF2341 domain-containing protein [Candidatus Altiarchaeota archaeon]|nr:DUF2341 domain-containing protein [Candidatus Altiarchaeota archaeon]